MEIQGYSSVESCVARISPEAQNELEKTAIFNDPRLKEILNGKEILEISEFCVQDNGDKEYLVRIVGSALFARATIQYINFRAKVPTFTVAIGNLELPEKYATGLRGQNFGSLIN